jgi:hypothetical protein
VYSRSLYSTWRILEITGFSVGGWEPPNITRHSLNFTPVHRIYLDYTGDTRTFTGGYLTSWMCLFEGVWWPPVISSILWVMSGNLEYTPVDVQ